MLAYFNPLFPGVRLSGLWWGLLTSKPEKKIEEKTRLSGLRGGKSRDPQATGHWALTSMLYLFLQDEEATRHLSCRCGEQHMYTSISCLGLCQKLGQMGRESLSTSPCAVPETVPFFLFWPARNSCWLFLHPTALQSLVPLTLPHWSSFAKDRGHDMEKENSFSKGNKHVAIQEHCLRNY